MNSVDKIQALCYNYKKCRSYLLRLRGFDMYRKTEYIEASFEEADVLVRAYFGADEAATEAFNAICRYMLNVDNGFIIRMNEDVIGLCRAGEYFRFYILKKNGAFFIKFKHYTDAVNFESADLERYLSDCDSVNEYFERNIPMLLLKKRSRVVEKTQVITEQGDIEFPARRKKKRFKYSPDIWKHVCERLAQETKLAVVHKSAFTEGARKNYTELIEILTSACGDAELLGEVAGDVLLHRIVRYRSLTLEELGNKYGVTREWIRQVEVKSKRRFTMLMSKYETEYTLRAVELFLRIPEGEALETVAYVFYKNKALGELLLSWMSNGSVRTALTLAVNKLL